ncbi:MAG: glutamate--tRNA ligase [Candidatus Falkowbacteria bacterium]
MSDIRLRFAPSPTGFVHIGSLRTVLYNFLIAKSLGGKLILRIEDTDQKREVLGAAEHLVQVLDWVGIKFDEGPEIGGSFGPYIQSQRREIYDQYAERLLATGNAYRCFCSVERIQKLKEDLIVNKLPPRYDGTCRHIDSVVSAERAAKGEPFTIRQAIPTEGELVVHDELRGDITFKVEHLEDHVLIKTDGMPTYQFANVIDDHLMEITHVVRGDEWIPSFPKNILLYRAFDWQPPKFVHIPLILNKEGGKLSKRHSDVAVEDYKVNGYLPEAMINFCTLLGWHPKGDNEILSLPQIVAEFNINNIGISPAIFDLDKLNYFNGYYIRQLSLEDLTKKVKPYLIEANLLAEESGDLRNNLTGDKISEIDLQAIVGLARDRLKKLNEISELTDFIFQPKLKFEPELLMWKNFEKPVIVKNLSLVQTWLELVNESSWNRNSLEEIVIKHIADNNLTVGEVLWPMRVALTGRKASPGPFEVAEVLGKKSVLIRLHSAIAKLS